MATFPETIDPDDLELVEKEWHLVDGYKTVKSKARDKFWVDGRSVSVAKYELEGVWKKVWERSDAHPGYSITSGLVWGAPRDLEKDGYPSSATDGDCFIDQATEDAWVYDGNFHDGEWVKLFGGN